MCTTSVVRVKKAVVYMCMYIHDCMSVAPRDREKWGKNEGERWLEKWKERKSEREGGEGEGREKEERERKKNKKKMRKGSLVTRPLPPQRLVLSG